MARFRTKKCLLVVSVAVVILFMVKTFLMAGEMSGSGDDSGLDGKQPPGGRPNEHHQDGNKMKIADLALDVQGVGIDRPPIHKEAHNFGSPVQQGASLKSSLGNYELEQPPRKAGPGEMGLPVRTSPKEQEAEEKSIKEYGFNQYVSDKISLDRNIPDLRNAQCKYWHYPEKLPTTSVIIVFHNEGWSTLLRTVHSVINRSPPELLHEIVMVDDFSTKDHLKKRLDDYVESPQFMGKVKVVHNKRREGLIRTRIIGARAATGDVLLWLDAHCEVGINWLPPLLTPIAVNRTTAVCPIIDVIDNQNYRVYPQGTGDQDRGGFDWSLYWKHFPLPEFEKTRRKYETEPYRSPAMAGGLFAMDRKFFFELGAYDEGLEIWGGENFELSFKIWMCGGSLIWVPCSRVGHVYRILGRVPYSSPNGSMMMLSERNLKRVVEVWFDDYKEYFYRSKPEAMLVSVGDLEKQLAFRRRMKCRSFTWYMSEIAPDIVDKYPLPAANIQWGEVKTAGARLCVDSMGQKDGGKIGMSYCHGAGGNQLFRLTEDGQFRIHDQCAYKSSSDIRLRRCDTTKYHWAYNTDTQALYIADQNLCLDHRATSKELFMMTCDPAKKTQHWEISSKGLKHH
ncbi:N-acetylgalactosaminyltransferase 7-like isoform X1 [Acanthaster planci]|uniref:Polypeptide N-acetylgalactosaminyltransferase n=2 Tax=Acanthaster planci TaxID=133434 RepID=A0A8B7XQH5_ACAPL|nr:N-acetylgalactosaminyltransferase 7-like isoform X1 [Acanthaster planci]